MSEERETFEYQRGPHRALFVVLRRKLPEDFEREDQRKFAFWMRAQKIVAVVTARRARGQKTYEFYETSEAGRVGRHPAGKIF